MGYNLENARNGKSISQIAKWPSLRPLALKSKYIRQFEFSENLEDFYVFIFLLLSRLVLKFTRHNGSIRNV